MNLNIALTNGIVSNGQKSFRISSQDIVSADTVKCRYTEFIVNVGRHFFASFYVGANFTRRCTALECLEKLFKTFSPNDSVANDCFDSLTCDASNADILFRCLDDTFDKNSLIAIDILKNFPPNITKLDDPIFVRANWFDFFAIDTCSLVSIEQEYVVLCYWSYVKSPRLDHQNDKTTYSDEAYFNTKHDCTVYTKSARLD